MTSHIKSLILLVFGALSISFHAQASESLEDAPKVQAFLEEFLADISGYGFKDTQLIEGYEAVFKGDMRSCDEVTALEARNFLLNLVITLTDWDRVSKTTVAELNRVFGEGRYLLCDHYLPVKNKAVGDGIQRTVHFNPPNGAHAFALRFSYEDTDH
ncbi:MAG: hypothetical protein KDD22_03680 [Bdellovibrionales bacterium]|nr:hypothetical protein [Bdellovibrionales bacterium]